MVLISEWELIMDVSTASQRCTAVSTVDKSSLMKNNTVLASLKLTCLIPGWKIFLRCRR